MNSRLDEIRRRHAGELALAEAEQELSESKPDVRDAAGLAPLSEADYQALKARVRALRLAARTATAGDVVARPDTVHASTDMPTPGTVSS